MTGTITGPITNNLLTLMSGGQSYSLTATRKHLIYLNGAQTTSGVLLPGELLKVHYYNGVVLHAEVSQRADGSPFTAYNYTAYRYVHFCTNNVILIVNGNQAQAITLNDKAFVYRSGVPVSASALTAR